MQEVGEPVTREDCEQFKTAIEKLARKTMEMRLIAGTHPREIKEEIKKIYELTEEIARKVGCDIDLSTLKSLAEEAEEDAEELETTKEMISTTTLAETLIEPPPAETPQTHQKEYSKPSQQGSA